MTTALADLKILALDCQTTGANPNKGHLLEIGWFPWNPARPFAIDKPALPDLRAYLIRLPSGAVIPRAVQRITGITDESLAAGLPSEIVWQHLIETLKEVNCENPSPVCPTVIHFARFEEPFLRELHRKNNPTDPFPFQIICTHEIAIRLLPNLPRRGIRAMAGYFGHSMPEFKRSSDHAVATVFIWQKMVELLNKTCGIIRPDQLMDWLADTKPANRAERSFPMNPQVRRKLPDKPGVYRMLRAKGELLYIGKAKSLKQRVNSYFRQKAPHAEHTLEMLTQARELNFTQSGSALEAAMLESDEIKRHSPPYNIALRKRQRRLVFCSKDLRVHSPVADKHYSIGPLPDGKFIESILAFRAWLACDRNMANDRQTELGYTLLALPPEYAPEITCLRDGLHNFRDNYRSRLNRQSPLRFLTGLGAELWRKRLESAVLAESAPETESNQNEIEEEQRKTEEEFAWTPEAVTKTIEKMVLHSAHRIRRARWFCLLSESALAWTSADHPDKDKTVVVFKNGSVFERKDMQIAEKTPVPPGFAKLFQTRQNNIDLMTYDRLRVVTTELRRLISEGRKIELRLNPTAILGHQQVTKALRWV
ncbi:MAG: GIY-YIG nuclease family protein [Deltaproteobacteria bacterium]|nr:GIY-YIG nuclease family protein [Deltaproteobacteria bacterium]